MSRVKREFAFSEYKKTTVFLDPESAAILKALFPMRREGVRAATSYINHAIKCLANKKITPLPGSVKKPLPDIYSTIRSRITMVWSKSETIALRDKTKIVIPHEWWSAFHQEARLERVAITTLIQSRMGMYLAKEDIRQMAVEKNVPYNYMFRELLQNVFPNIPLCAFPPSTRGNLARLDARVNKYTVRKGDRRKEERRVLTGTKRMVATLTTESSEEAKAFYATLTKE